MIWLKRYPTEAEEGCALIAWGLNARWRGIPLAELLIHIPNGAYLGGTPSQRQFQMVRLKKQGFQVGVSDYFLPVRVGRPSSLQPDYGGLWIELKRQKGNKASPEQRLFHGRMRILGYDTAVCLGFEEARTVIESYLAQTGHPVVFGFNNNQGENLSWPSSTPGAAS